MLQLPNEPISIGRVFATATQVWRATVSKTWVLALLLLVWTVLPYFLDPNLNTHNPVAWANTLPEKSIAAAVYFIVIIILYAAVFAQVRLLLAGQSNSFLGSLAISIANLGYLISALIFTAISLAIGFAVLIIPDIIMMVVFMAYFPLIIMDDLNPITAYKRCFELMLHHWVRAFTVLVVPSAIVFIIGTIIDLFGRHILVIAHPAGHGELWLFNHILRVVVGTLYLPFYAPLIMTLINDLKLRRANA